MTFPSTYEIIKHFNVFLITGPILIIVSISFWFLYYFRFRRWSSPAINLRLRTRDHSDLPAKRYRTPSQALAIAIISMIIGGVHLLIYLQVSTAFRFRFNTAEVEEIRIARFQSQSTEPYRRQADQPLIIRDTTLIRRNKGV